jgi:hypothetical protein
VKISTVFAVSVWTRVTSTVTVSALAMGTMKNCPIIKLTIAKKVDRKILTVMAISFKNTRERKEKQVDFGYNELLQPNLQSG